MAAQRDRAVLWLPLAVIAGAAVYFCLPRAPSPWLVVALMAGGALLALASAAWPAKAAWRRALRIVLAYGFVATSAVGLGLAAGVAREWRVGKGALAAPVGPVKVQGWVSDLDRGATRPRLTILTTTVEGVAAPPRLIRVSTTDAGALTPARAVICRVMLAPPAGPMAPGAYDSAFAAHFARIGATGYSLGACRPSLEAPRIHWLDRFWLQASAYRRAITETILDASPGQGGAVAAALITGDRSAINTETTEIFQSSGLQHLLSVSGYHMSLVAGLIYGALHVALALVPGFALRFPIRKWAAATAIIGAGLYLVLSGMSVPAQRAFIMTAVVLGAVLVDRPAITMRGLAVAALIVTLLAPESVLTPGFQMSFAATAALIAAFEVYQARRTPGLPAPGLLIGSLQATGRWMGGALLASFVAGLATDPFALFHFQRVQIYALAANLAATPIVTLVVAPAAGLAAALAPFGYAEAPLRLMAWGLDVLVAIGGAFSDRPEAVRGLPKPSDVVFVLWCGAIAWACLWRGKLRWFALAPLALGGLLYATGPRPILLVDGSANAVIARAADGGRTRWVAVADRRAAFERERLAQLVGVTAAEAERLPPPPGCGETSCLWRSEGGRLIAIVAAESALPLACRRGAIVIAKLKVSQARRVRCGPATVIDRASFAQHGGAAIYATRAGVRVVRARSPGHARAWDGPLTDNAE